MDTSGKAAGARASDGELLGRFASCGDQRAFSELIGRHGPMVVRICRRLNGGDAHGADDAAQQVFLALASRAGVLRTRVSLAGWLYRTSWHIAARHRRAEGLRADYEQRAAVDRRGRDAAAAADENGDVPFAVVTAELSAALDRALGTLPENHRNALVLHHLGGLTVEETAQQMAVKVGTAASWLSRGRAALRAKLEDMGYAVSLGVISAWLDANAAAARDARCAAMWAPGPGRGSVARGIQGGDAGGSLTWATPVPGVAGVGAAGTASAAGAAGTTPAAAASLFALSRTAAVAVVLFASATTAVAGHAAVTHFAALTKAVLPPASAAISEDRSSKPVGPGVSNAATWASASSSAAVPEPSSCVFLIAAGGLALLRRPARLQSPGG